MKMEELIGNMGILKGFDHISPAEMAIAEKDAWGTLFTIVEEAQNGMLTAETQTGRRFHLPKSDFEDRGRPKFHIGDKAIDASDNVPVTICGAEWHSKRKEFFWIVEKNGKEKSRWYFSEDLLPVNS